MDPSFHSSNYNYKMDNTFPHQGLILLSAQNVEQSHESLEAFITLSHTLLLGQKIVVVGDPNGLPKPLINDADWLMIYNTCYTTPMISSIRYALDSLQPSIESVLICRSDQLESTTKHLIAMLHYQKKHLTQMIHLSSTQIFPICISKHQFIDWEHTDLNDHDYIKHFMHINKSIPLI
jgi:hypothetical protein